MKKLFILVIGPLLSAGCMTFTPPQTPNTIPQIKKTFVANYDTAWRQIMQGLTASGYVIDAQDKDTGIIRLQPFIHYNPSKEQAADMGDCGTLSQNWNFIKFTRQIIIKDNPAGIVTVQIKFDYMAYAIDNFLNQRWQPCFTTGHLEEKLLKEIAGLLTSPTTNKETMDENI